jgi:hypothetical protein
MERKKMMLDCKVCNSSFQFGPGVYDGKHIRAYNMTVCKTCWDSNWDGWNPSAEAVILRHLEEQGIDIPQRIDGLIPRQS